MDIRNILCLINREIKKNSHK